MHKIPRSLLWSLFLLAALLGGNLAAILFVNGGHATYMLDDPYIHLAMAENLLQGHYGVNLGEVSAPSSSILWPFLLAPFEATPLGEFAPFLLNAVFAALILATLHAVLRRAVKTARGELTALALAMILVATRILPVAFTGMEHLLQAWLTAAVALGLVIDAREDRMPAWLPAVLVLGPLVRYENLALTLSAAAYLVARRRIAAGAGAAAITGILLAGFSAWLVRHGLDPLPASVNAKASLPAMMHPTGESAGPGFWTDRVAGLLQERPHPALLAALMLPMLRFILPGAGRKDLGLAAVAVCAIGAHLVLGRHGAFGRYTLYALVFSAAISIHLYGPFLARAARRYGDLAPRPRALAFSLMALCIVGAWLLSGPRSIPLGAGNIYAQQYQMHRFTAGLQDVPVAVNDLGWATYHHDAYVLDLWGLANPEARRRLLPGETGGADSLAREHGVRLAMVYDSWLGDNIPASWTRLGKLRLAMPRVTVASSQVTFYATRPEDAPEFRKRLHDFAATLPSLARFSFDAAPGANP
jgi:hypothetical protein